MNFSLKSFVILLSLLVFALGCNPVAETQIGADFSPGVIASLTNSTLSVSNPQVATGQSVSVTLQMKDQNNTVFETNRHRVTFATSGGSSTGTMSSVRNNLDGTYTGTFTGLVAGTPTTIRAYIDGAEITSSLPTIQVTSGTFSLAQSQVVVSAGSVTSANSVNVTLRVKDELGNQVSDGGLNVTFSHSGGSSTGTFSAVTDNLNGTYSATFTGIVSGSATTIEAKINGSVVTTTLPTVVVNTGAPASISVSANNNQSGTVGTTLTSAFTAVVRDVNNNLVPGVMVDWAIATGGGSLSSASNSTNVSGLSSSTLTLGTTAGTQTVMASISGTAASVIFSATASAGAATAISVYSGSGQSATVGTTLSLPLIVLIKDVYNNMVNGASVDWTVTSGGGVISSCTPTSNSSGLAQCSYTLGTVTGTNTITATINGTATSTSFTATGNVGSVSLSQSTLAMSSGSLTSGSSTTLTITLKDSYGNRILDNSRAGNLSLRVLSTGTSSGTIGAISPVSGNDGAYEASFTATIAGTTNSIRASYNSNDFTSGDQNFSVTFGTPVKLVFIQGPSNTQSGQTISPSVTVAAQDASGNTVTNYASNIVLAIDTNPNSGTLSGTLLKAPVNGIATFNDVSINYYGTGYKLSGTSGGLTQATSSAFNILSTAVSYDWPFTSGTMSSYTGSDWSKIDFTGGVVRLTPTVQTDSESTESASGTITAGTKKGVVFGTLSDGVTQGFRIGNGGSCDGSSTNCAEMDATWTPQWSNLLGYWKLNGTWSDSKGSNHFVPNGDSNFSSGAKIGSKASLHDGAGDSANATLVEMANWDWNSNFTVSLWIKPDIIDNPSDGIFRPIHFTCNGGTTYAFQLWLNDLNNSPAGLIRFYRYNGTSTAAINGPVLSQTNYSHIVLKKASSTLELYLNGYKVGTTTDVASVTTTCGLFQIGSTNYKGLLDEIAFWNTPLSETEIKTIFDRQSAKFAGEFTSRIMDAKSTSSWTTLNWLPSLPYWKELPDAACTAPCTHSNSESSLSYPLLVGSTGSTIDDNLMSGIVGLWHLNETAATTGSNNDFKDDSGNGNHGEALNGSLNFGSLSLFDKSIRSSAVSSVVVPHSTSLNIGSGDFAVSLWFRTNVLPTAATYPRLFSKETGSGGTRTGITLVMHSTADLGFETWYNGSAAAVRSGTYSVDGLWHHAAVMRKGSTLYLYIDGVLGGTGTFSNDVRTTAPFYIGSAATVQLFNGAIDEVAVWNRSLHVDEIKQLYQRGSSRIKFQVRTCNDNACDGESWQGPDGTSGSYFSELNNNTTQLNGTGDVKNILPSMTFSNFTTPPTSNQFFQYRAILESDSATTTLRPEMKSISVDPLHYDTSSPSIYGNNGVAFADLDAFTETLGSGGCTSSVGYNLSLDKAIWKYFNGSNWVTADGSASQSNSASTLNTNVSSFGTQVGKGTVYVKAYLKSSGTSPCELDNIQITGSK